MKQRADGFYRSSIVVGRTPEGKPVRRYAYTKKKRELPTLIAALRLEYAKGTASDKRVTITLAAESWQEAHFKGKAYKTTIMYKGVIKNHILPRMGHMLVTDLKRHHISDFLADLAEADYGKRTLEQVRLTISLICDWAVSREIIQFNPALKIKMPDAPEGTRRPLTEEEIKIVRSTASTRPGIYHMLCLYAGLRRGEALALHKGDIDLKEKTITVRRALHYEGNTPVPEDPKTKAGKRTIPIPDVLYDDLAAHVKRTRGKILFQASGGGYMTSTALRYMLEQYNKKAGLTITPHMLRHTYCTMLYESDIDIKTAQALMGHASFAFTADRYTHISKEKNTLAVTKLNEKIRADDGKKDAGS